jgi:hypothetical protein
LVARWAIRRRISGPTSIDAHDIITRGLGGPFGAMENLLRKNLHTGAMTAEAGGPAVGAVLRYPGEAVGYGCATRRLVLILDRLE